MARIRTLEKAGDKGYRIWLPKRQVEETARCREDQIIAISDIIYDPDRRQIIIVLTCVDKHDHA